MHWVQHTSVSGINWLRIPHLAAVTSTRQVHRPELSGPARPVDLSVRSAPVFLLKFQALSLLYTSYNHFPNSRVWDLSVMVRASIIIWNQSNSRQSVQAHMHLWGERIWNFELWIYPWFVGPYRGPPDLCTSLTNRLQCDYWGHKSFVPYFTLTRGWTVVSWTHLCIASHMCHIRYTF